MIEPRSSHEEPRPNGLGPIVPSGPDQGRAGGPRDSTVNSNDSNEDAQTLPILADHVENPSTPRSEFLQICTDVPPFPGVPNTSTQPHNDTDNGTDNDNGNDNDNGLPLHRSTSASGFPQRAPSVRAALSAMHSSAGSLSPGSAFSSPTLAALTDITPLPSPIQRSISPWLGGSNFSLSRTSSAASQGKSTANSSVPTADTSVPSRSSSLHLNPGQSYPSPPKTQDSFAPSTLAAPKPSHARNRSLSEYHPTTALHVPQPRNVAASDSNRTQSVRQPRHEAVRGKLHREEYLAVQRGIALPRQRPDSRRRVGPIGHSDDEEPLAPLATPEKPPVPTYDVRSIRSSQRRRYRKIRQLGQGTFSQVVLAMREEYNDESGSLSPTVYSGPPRLVAIKVVEYGPAGGACEERVEVSLKREVEILKSLNHPSVVQLKAFGSDSKMVLLVLNYCPGGDLFELASKGLSPLTPELIRRIFAELVGAASYLHQNLIVHRDIKLENVLVNLPLEEMRVKRDWQTYPRAVITLSDLGLSRRLPEPPESPLLRTRCGSEDYAAPEILMGQPYDGRSTDGWALAVLLYAIMEGRLPFDPLPSARGDPVKLRARTPHRIARCEWSWYKHADEDGEWDPVKGKDLEGARHCVEGLLRRSTKRMTLDEVAQTDWVTGSIDVPGGLKRGDQETP